MYYWSACFEREKRMQIRKLGRRTKMMQLDKMFKDNRQEIKMQRHKKEKKQNKTKLITLKPEAGEMIRRTFTIKR